MGDKEAAAVRAEKTTQVAKDRILKDNVAKVTKNQILVWPSRWNWLVEENRKMYEAMAGKRPLSPYDWSRYHARDKPDSPRTARRSSIKAAVGKEDRLMFPPVPTMPAQPAIPATTNGWYGFLPNIGGRSVVSERQKWCKGTVGQHNITRVLGWPDIYD